MIAGATNESIERHTTTNACHRSKHWVIIEWEQLDKVSCYFEAVDG